MCVRKKRKLSEGPPADLTRKKRKSDSGFKVLLQEKRDNKRSSTSLSSTNLSKTKTASTNKSVMTTSTPGFGGSLYSLSIFLKYFFFPKND